MEDLEHLRDEIDEIDSKLIELYIKRMEISDKVAAYKARRDLPILDPVRERAVLQDRKSRAPKELQTNIEVLFDLIMQNSRLRQAKAIQSKAVSAKQLEDALAASPSLFPKHAKVAVQGLFGSYQQLAAEKLFRRPDLSFYQSFEQVFQAVEQDVVDFGILPIENSTAGSVNKVMDLMRKHNFSIVRACRMKIDHNLMAKKGANKDEIEEVLSHEQALQQCQSFFAKHPKLHAKAVENTAIAARKVAESNNPKLAAIASRQAAAHYNLEILEHDIQDQDNNYTRFAVIAKKLTIYPGANRSTLMLTTNNDPGALYKLLAKFYALDINLIKLESRPIPKRDFEFMFYFDVDCEAADPHFKELLETLEPSCPEFRYLGSYTEVI